MKLTTSLMALSIVICSSMMPLTAQAYNNEVAMIMMNNVSNQEQAISNKINAYVNSGQLSPQQGAAFNSELSQISSQAMMGGPGQEMAVMNELNSFSAQVDSSIGAPGQYVYGGPGYGTPGYGTPGYVAPVVRGFYSNWRHPGAYGNANSQALRAEERQQHTNTRAEQEGQTNMVRQEQHQQQVNSHLQEGAAAGQRMEARPQQQSFQQHVESRAPQRAAPARAQAAEPHKAHP